MPIIKKEIKIMKKLEGKMVANGAKIGIVAARFNEFIVSKLVSGAEDALLRHDVNPDDITVAWVPGAFEIPLIAKKMAKSGKYDAVICLGAVIRGATSHYDYVCSEVSKGVASVSLETGVPVMFGVLTTFVEWDSIHSTTGKKIRYMFTFPLFMLTYVPIALVALVKKCNWKPIKHSINVDVQEFAESESRRERA